MFVFELLSDECFEDHLVGGRWMVEFITTFLRYLTTSTPPSDGQYTRSPISRHPGLSLKMGPYVSFIEQA